MKPDHCRPVPASQFPRAPWPIEDDDDCLESAGTGPRGFQHVLCKHSTRGFGIPIVHADSMIVAIDGACPNNGNNRAVKSACGVYFGNEYSDAASHNRHWRVPDHHYYTHTNQRAEIHAAIGALRSVAKFVDVGGHWPVSDGPCRVRHIVIKSDSAYLVNSIINHANKWVRNGWRTYNKTPVANRDLWEELIRRLKHIRQMGAWVDFWLVPREMNEDADGLANRGLRGRL